MRQTRRSALILLSSIGLLYLSGCSKQEAPRAAGPPPATPVAAVNAVMESVPTEIRVVGTVEASAIVQVKSQIAGQLERVAFTEGQNVSKGDLLFVIDSRPYQEAVRQAEAAVERDQALINQAEAAVARDTAQAQFMATDAARYAELSKAGVVSKSQADQTRTNAEVSKEAARATQAAIASARASLVSDQAAVAAAKLNLSFCQITAPISGRVGNLLVHQGNLVKVNDVPLVVIHQVSPVFVNFSVPEQHLATIRRLSTGRKLPVRVFAKDNPSQAAAGHLAVIDNAVDTTTGTIRLKAEFENANRTLWPGQFVTTVLTLDTIQNAIVVPVEAVQAGQNGPFVFVVNAEQKAEVRPVKTGLVLGEKTIIEQGVSAGEKVVVDGQLRLAPGFPVTLVEVNKKPMDKL